MDLVCATVENVEDLDVDAMLGTEISVDTNVLGGTQKHVTPKPGGSNGDNDDGADDAINSDDSSNSSRSSNRSSGSGGDIGRTTKSNPARNGPMHMPLALAAIELDLVRYFILQHHMQVCVVW